MRLAILGGVLAASLGLSGCVTSGGLTSQALSNLEHCRRTYTGSTGGLGPPSLALHIECDARPFEAPKAEPIP